MYLYVCTFFDYTGQVRVINNVNSYLVVNHGEVPTYIIVIDWFLTAEQIGIVYYILLI